MSGWLSGARNAAAAAAGQVRNAAAAAAGKFRTAVRPTAPLSSTSTNSNAEKIELQNKKVAAWKILMSDDTIENKKSAIINSEYPWLLNNYNWQNDAKKSLGKDPYTTNLTTLIEDSKNPESSNYDDAVNIIYNSLMNILATDHEPFRGGYKRKTCKTRRRQRTRKSTRRH